MLSAICFNLHQSKILLSSNELNAEYDIITSYVLIFSSPEHKVLMVSFCDRPNWRPSCVIHNFFKHLLLNHRANLDETWQGCSLGEALPKLFKRLNSNHNSGCHGNQKENNSKIFENLLL